MNSSEIQQYKTNLEAKKDLLLEELSGVSQKVSDNDGDVQAISDDVGSSLEDNAQEAGELDRNQAMVAELKQELTKVEDALAKIANGDYGKCVSCSADIHPARLEAMPIATHCIDCATKAELV